MSQTSSRSPWWKWQVCGLLLLATMLNYMDRLTVNQSAREIMWEFGLDKADYGRLEAAFSLAFGLGALLAGAMADRWNVWWLYPSAVAANNTATAYTRARETSRVGWTGRRRRLWRWERIWA